MRQIDGAAQKTPWTQQALAVPIAWDDGLEHALYGRTHVGGKHVFDGFTLEHIDTGEAALRVRYGGAGPAVVLLHGHPRTHATWHGVAPLLTPHYTVVCPDLRGYGASSKPPTTPDHAPYSKRAMARDVLAVMRTLGHDCFAVVGHDRGAYVSPSAWRWTIPPRSAIWPGA